MMRLRVRAYPDRVEAHFNDDGVVFVEQPAPDVGAEYDPLDLPESGRGLTIAQAYVDQLDYRRTAEGSNEWRLVKRFA